MLAYLHVLFSGTTLNWVRRLGGPGLVLWGLADNSIVPLPGSMDVLTIWLAAGHRRWWPYYAAMATIGALIGGYITYGLARKGGKEALEAKLSKDKVRKIYGRFERWGFRAVAIPALLPPPFPIVPFLLAAGALQYPRKKFLAALALGRGVRFTIIAGLGALYGRHIVGFFFEVLQASFDHLDRVGGSSGDLRACAISAIQERQHAKACSQTQGSVTGTWWQPFTPVKSS